MEEMVIRQNAFAIAADATNYVGVESVNFFTLDIDGNDIHVCDPFISALSPKLVFTEYNSKFPPSIAWAMNYDESHSWYNDDYFRGYSVCVDQFFSQVWLFAGQL